MPTTAPRRTLKDLLGTNRPNTRDEVLLSIEGQEVTIASVEIEIDHQGRWRKYPLTTVTLDDGRTFTVAGSAIAGPLGELQPEDFPIGAVFYREASSYEPGATFWAVR